MDPSEARGLFPIVQKRVYLFGGGMAPATTRTRAVIERYADELTSDAADLYRRQNEDFVAVRRLFAGLIGADEDEVAITDCTSAGANLAVELIEPRPGGNVVFDEMAYPSAVYPWMLPPRAHIERRFVKQRDGLTHLDDMAQAIDDNTIAVSISHVSERTGFRHDLGAVAGLAHARGAPLIVDAMQAAGALRIDVHEEDVDFLTSGAVKWLLGAPGVGFFYAARRYLDRMPPHAGAPGAMKDQRPWGLREFQPRSGAERFQIGMPNILGMAATRPGLELLVEVGMDTVEPHILDLSGYCIAGLRERGLPVLTPERAEQRAGIVAMDMDDCVEAFEFLHGRGIDICPAALTLQVDTLRLDAHVFNNHQDIDRFMAELDAYLAQR